MNIHSDSRPAVYNSRSTGITPSDSGAMGDMVRELESQNSLTQQNSGGQASDTNQTAINHSNNMAEDTPLRLGKVLMAMPYIHCYRVQLAGQQGVCVATAVTSHAHTPIGVRCGNVIPPNSDVLVWKPKSGNLAYIIGVIPCETFLDEFNPSDLLQQGGNSGPKKVAAYRNIPKATTNAHGWLPQSSGRPMDGTVNEYVRMSETGIGLLIDSFQAYLRVNEACGLFLNYFDSYARLAALSLDIQSYCEHITHRNDEGETNSVRGCVMFPWEAVGMYAAEEKFTKANPAESVQLDKDFPYAAEDIDQESTDQEPIYRYAEYTGYIGQGFMRTVMKPAKTSGKRLMRDAEKDKDVGLFQESLTLDGAWGLRSAKSVMLVKYPLISIPRRLKAVEDATGDDLTNSPDYKFSGKFGTGDEHRVEDWKQTTENVPYLLRPAGVMDLIAHHYNWKSTHPFEYHKKDYSYYDESEADTLGPVEFCRGSKTNAYETVTPTTLKIDDRYKDVNYYNTMSLITLTEDGSVVIADGFASQIVMTGGQIRLEATGDLMLMSASRVVGLSDEIIMRAKGSVDISSSDSDVRLKAERNMQLLAANGGVGGMLLESKGTGITQEYKDRIGTEVKSTGIVLLSRGGNVSTLAKDVYVRSGVEAENPEGTGAIVLDCANGRSPMISYARVHGVFNSEGMGIWHGPLGQDQTTLVKSHFFGPNFSKISGPTVMEKSVVICEGSLGVDQSIYAKKHIAAMGRMAQASGGLLGDSSKDDFPLQVNRFIDDFCESAESVTDVGQALFNSGYSEFVWKDTHPGNTELLSNEIGFSFRDLSSRNGSVYDYADGKFMLLETRWQQLQRAGLVAGSQEGWTENTVSYQGNELMPWPGKKNWKDDSQFLQYNNGNGFLLFDTGGFAKDRDDSKTDYERPKFADWKKSKCDESYTL